jgi:tetraacyldisaccharide 4'-kinase
LESLAGRRVLAFCGIGNPAGFRHTLASSGYDIADFIEFPDHHRYTDRDVDRLSRWSRQHADAAAVICTHKDLVKVNREQIADLPLWALEIGVAIREGRDLLEQRLEGLVISHSQH